MSDDDRIGGSLAYGVSARIASRPRLVTAVALTLLLVATQGTVGAETTASAGSIEVGTNAGASSSTGP